jgi:pSer/pThr/pTyr-binding forkhead associated (FHA) protein
MSADPNKKSARTFQCRDVLWETFEQMARELECSVDYLVNESMKQYARQRSYGGSRTPYPTTPGRADPPSGADRAPLPPAPEPPPPLPSSGRPVGGGLPAPGRVPPPPGRAPGHAPPAGARSALPAPPAARASVSVAPPVPTRSAPPPPMPVTRSVPPPLPRSGHSKSSVVTASANGSHGAALSLLYNGERHSITKDRYVIGRGKQSSDLTLKDPNVSRQHAMIEFQNGVYFMVDMGSTNGVAINGQRIARKQIAEGDVFRICDHDLLFTYR